MKVKEPGTGRVLLSINNFGDLKIHSDDALERCPVEYRTLVRFLMGKAKRSNVVQAQDCDTVNRDQYKRVWEANQELTKKLEFADRKIRELKMKLMVYEPPFG